MFHCLRRVTGVHKIARHVGNRVILRVVNVDCLGCVRQRKLTVMVIPPRTPTERSSRSVCLGTRKR
jgi:hypothetical protein